ncbi:Uncharacterized protein SCF082_LOCUS27653, partial [Durusdinium trenchii]
PGARPGTPAAQGRPARSPKTAGKDWRALQGSLRQALRKHCGDSWPSQLLSTFGLQRKDGVDANVLQSALRSLGVPVFSSAQVASAVRAAKASSAGLDGRGPLPSAGAVVAAIHGPLNGARSRAVDEVFFDLGGDIHGTLPRQTLKR